MKSLFLIPVLFLSIASFSQKPIFTNAKVTGATVYSNGAEISQTTLVNIPKGTMEIVIKNVADYLNESTVQISAPSSLTVLSVQFTQNYISEYEIDESNPSIKKVRDSINLLQKDLVKIQIDKISNTKTVELLDKNQQVAGQNSGLSVTELMKLVDYYKTKRTELSNAITSLQEKETNLNEKLKKLNAKLELNSKNEEKTSKGKLIVQVMNYVAGNVNLDLNYMTNNASWVPFYDLRAENIKEPINMMYKAQVIQNTGIDWKQVKLTLSSGNPNQNNEAPILQAWFLRYGNPLSHLNYGRQNAPMNRIQGVASGAKMEADVLEETSISNYTTLNENQLNVSFDIDIPYDVLSNGKVHSVALKEIKLPANYRYYAVPRVEKEAFLIAQLNDYSKYNILPGEANIIFEGMYVGKTFINPNQTVDTLSLSMGRDKKISIKREKVIDKSGTKFLSSYKEQTFTYDIAVRNNKKEAVEMLLKDQYPISTDKEVTIEVLEKDKAKVNEETGIMTWELKLAPNETKKLRISYKVRYPKDKVFDNL